MLESLVFIAAAGSDGTGGIAGEFGLNWKLVVAQMVNFAIVAFLLYRFAFKPVLATIEERQKKISDGLQYAEEMKRKLAESEKKHAETIREAQQEAQRILGEARTQAKEYVDNQTAEAAAKVEDMLERGREANELERQKMLSDVRKEVARLVVQTAGRVLDKELDSDEKARLNRSAAMEIAEVR